MTLASRVTGLLPRLLQVTRGLQGTRRLQTTWLLRSAVLTSLLLPALAAAKPRKSSAEQTLRVQVVEVAGGRAYLNAGSARHLRTGDVVRIGKRKYSVVAHNQGHAVIEIGSHRLRRGQRGFVRVRPHPLDRKRRLPPPRQLASFQDLWPLETPVPASEQSPKPVPLGPIQDPRRSRALLSANYFLTAPLSGDGKSIGKTVLRARLHHELSSVPVAFDVDGFTELWHAADLGQRPYNISRPAWNLNQLELGYRGTTLQAAAGRLRYAAATLGRLDGGRAQAQLGEGWALAAFGGTLADPRTGGFDGSATRYGAELDWLSSDALSQASVTLFGSHFEGKADERRVVGTFQTFRDAGYLNGHTEVSFFDRDNPWAADPVELTALSLSGGFSPHESLRLQAAASARRPERSLWLASFFPQGFFCTATPIAGSLSQEPCQDSPLRYAGQLSATWDASSWQLSLGGEGVGTLNAEEEQWSAFLDTYWPQIAKDSWLRMGASAMTGTLLDRASIEVSAGSHALWDSVDLSAYYRPALSEYRAGSDTFIEHGFGSRLYWAPFTAWDLQGGVDVLQSDDVSVLFLHMGVAFRPRY